MINEIIAVPEQTPQETAAKPDKAAELPVSEGLFAEGIFAEEGYGDIKSRGRKRQRRSEVVLTQGMLCALLLASMLLLHVLNGDFQERLVRIYREQMEAPPAPWLEAMVQTIEGWFQRK